MTSSIYRYMAVPVLLLLLAAAAGCTEEGSTKDRDKGSPPLARVTLSSRYPDQGEEVSLSGERSNGTELTYSWDLGDDTGDTSVEVTHSYSDVGSRKVTLTVKDKWGRTDSDSVIIKVNYRRIVQDTLDISTAESGYDVPVQEMSAGFKLTLTFDSGQSVGGKPSNDLNLVVYYPNGTEAWSTAGDEPDQGSVQEEVVEVPQQMLAESYWQDWEAVVKKSTGRTVDFTLEIFVSY
jgi:PKD repeat protein